MKRSVKGFPGLYRETDKKGISRFRILINHNKTQIQEYFYFGASNSEAKAKKAATARWREIRESVPVLTKRKFRELVRNPTPTGIVGVTRITTVSKGHEYDVWKATWTTRRGDRKSRQFSINKYGEKEARRRAIQTRQNALDEIGEE